MPKPDDARARSEMDTHPGIAAPKRPAVEAPKRTDDRDRGRETRGR